MVKKFVEENPGTVLISTSDHETGGFTLARQVSNAYPEYLWYPDVLSRVKNSTVVLANAIHALHDVSDVEKQKVVADKVITEGLGIADATDDEMKFLLSNPSRSALDHFLADMVSIRAQLGVSKKALAGTQTEKKLTYDICVVDYSWT
jgi:alkaline phosphatase